MRSEVSSSPKRVLYVEDNDLVRELTCELLADYALEVVPVASGEAGLAAFQGGGFDIVVTDVSLPAMSGVDFVRHIKKLAPDPQRQPIRSGRNSRRASTSASAASQSSKGFPVWASRFCDRK